MKYLIFVLSAITILSLAETSTIENDKVRAVISVENTTDTLTEVCTNTSGTRTMIFNDGGILYTVRVSPKKETE